MHHPARALARLFLVSLAGVVLFGVLDASPVRAGSAAVYDTTADGREQIAAALVKAKEGNRRVLIQWGGNWCPWCRRLHQLYEKDPNISAKIQHEYEVVYLDAGGKAKKNMDLATTYGVDLAAHGVPFLTILDSDGKVVANQETGSLENKDQKASPGHDPAAVLEFLTKYQVTH